MMDVINAILILTSDVQLHRSIKNEGKVEKTNSKIYIELLFVICPLHQL